jgi:hypothetical protein
MLMAKRRVACMSFWMENCGIETKLNKNVCKKVSHLVGWFRLGQKQFTRTWNEKCAEREE